MGAGDRGQMVPATGVDAPPFGEQVLAVALVMVQARPALVNRHVVGVLRRAAPQRSTRRPHEAKCTGWIQASMVYSGPNRRASDTGAVNHWASPCSTPSATACPRTPGNSSAETNRADRGSPRTPRAISSSTPLDPARSVPSKLHDATRPSAAAVGSTNEDGCERHDGQQYRAQRLAVPCVA
jgi:hypothetical protein